MSDVMISGGGVVADQPLPEGTRLRLRPTGNPDEDVEVFVTGGLIHLVGHYRELRCDRGELNAVIVWPVV